MPSSELICPVSSIFFTCFSPTPCCWARILVRRSGVATPTSLSIRIDRSSNLPIASMLRMTATNVSLAPWPSTTLMSCAAASTSSVAFAPYFCVNEKSAR